MLACAPFTLPLPRRYVPLLLPSCYQTWRKVSSATKQQQQQEGMLTLTFRRGTFRATTAARLGGEHTRTGVISQDDSVLGAELAKSFGTFGTMSWRELAVPRCGGAVLESFDSSTLEAMDAAKRSETVDGIARDIAAAVSATAVVTPPEGCSVSGCSRWREDD